MKKFFKTLLKLSLSILFGLVLLEGVASIAAYTQLGTTNIAALHERSTQNAYLAELGEKSWAETISPHLFLGWVRTEAAVIRQGDRVNNVGLIGRDFPMRKDTSKFTVLVTGGSVADQFTRTGALEKLLNESGKFSKPVVVLNGATGSFAEPHQAIVVLLYGEIADAVITIEGANEAARGPYRLEYPHNESFLRANPITRHGADMLGAAWQSHELKTLSMAHNSRALFYLVRGIRNNIEARYEENPKENNDLPRYFSFPTDWSEDQRREFNYEQYKKYWRSIRALGTVHGFKQAHFVQPLAAFKNVLTAEELSRIPKDAFNEKSKAAYVRLENELLSVNSTEIPVFDLGNIFQDVTESVYTDQVHCNKHGYEIMARAVADKLIPLWQ